MSKTLLSFCGALLVFLQISAFAAPVQPGLYKGAIVIEEVFVDAGLTTKKTMPLRGRIRENGSFFLIGPPFGPSHFTMDGRIFTGSIQLGTAVINSVSGTDINGESAGAAINLPGSLDGVKLRFSWSSTQNVVAYGERKVTRSFTLRRVGP